MKLVRVKSLALFVVVLAGVTFSQSKKPVGKPSVSRKLAQCSSGTFLFKCPKNYKVLLSGKDGDRLFLAQSTEFRYGVFVVYEPTETSVSDLLPKIVKSFEPMESQDFKWKEVEADERKSSKFEIESKRQIGMNGGKAYLTIEHRIIDFRGKKLLTGTIVNGYEGPIGIKESFDEGTYTTNGGCFDSVEIIAAFTKEKADAETGPCSFGISISPVM